MATSNVQIVNRLINEVINQGDYSVLPNVVSDHYTYQAGDMELSGRDSLEHLLRSYKATFPDLNIAITEQISSGDQVITRGRLKGTQLGDYFELPASGKQVDVDLVIFSQIHGGKIVREFEMIDELTLLCQLGADAV